VRALAVSSPARGTIGRVPNPRARALRRDSTDSERHLWRLLRARRFAGHKFRRQHPIGPFTADFACTAARLVIEADGGQHADAPADARRTAWLQARGWCVLRFWNPDVLTHPEHVIDTILAALHDRAPAEKNPHPASPTSPAARER
jgi:very-short-patch-repair endonuclease